MTINYNEYESKKVIDMTPYVIARRFVDVYEEEGELAATLLLLMITDRDWDRINDLRPYIQKEFLKRGKEYEFETE